MRPRPRRNLLTGSANTSSETTSAAEPLEAERQALLLHLRNDDAGEGTGRPGTNPRGAGPFPRADESGGFPRLASQCRGGGTEIATRSSHRQNRCRHSPRARRGQRHVLLLAAPRVSRPVSNHGLRYAGGKIGGGLGEIPSRIARAVFSEREHGLGFHAAHGAERGIQERRVSLQASDHRQHSAAIPQGTGTSAQIHRRRETRSAGAHAQRRERVDRGQLPGAGYGEWPRLPRSGARGDSATTTVRTGPLSKD